MSTTLVMTTRGIEDVFTATDQIDGNVLEHFVCECILPSTVPTQCSKALWLLHPKCPAL